jgi:ribosomal protein S18 acetylase RimI-like enzyme
LLQLTALLERANEAPYDIRAVAGEKLFVEGHAGNPTVRVTGDMAGIAVTCGKYLRLLAVDRDQRRRGVGTALLRDAESRGAVVVAAEPGNYFTPGIVESDHASIAFFRKHGYQETATTQNLLAPLRAPASPRETNARSDRHEEVLNFIERNFGPIWRFEASHAETIFHVTIEDEIAGFATHEANNRGLGFFGPTGVAEEHRGKGLGKQLLLASLADLQRRGFETVVIPWTDAVEFYRRSCGATVAHKFTILRRIAP